MVVNAPHKTIDHGILINRGSTDRSVEICKLFAPHWEIRDSKVLEFDAVLVDRSNEHRKRNYGLENGVKYD